MELQKLYRIICIDQQQLAMLLIGNYPKLLFGFVKKDDTYNWLFFEEESIRAEIYMYEFGNSEQPNE